MIAPSSEQHRDTRTRLLEAAVYCFSEKGFDATGIREIAQRAQANSALVQYHFGGKEGLYAAALRCILSTGPVGLPTPPDPAHPEARARAIQAIGDMVSGLLGELMACTAGNALERASLILVTREMQSPRADMAAVLLDHLRPYIDIMQVCIRILRPELDRPAAMDHNTSILGQLAYLSNNLELIRLIRAEPDYARDLGAVARHITAFSLRGLGIPEAFPGA